MKVELMITPINEGHEIPYVEIFEGSFDALQERANELLNGLATLLPEGTWRLKVEEVGGNNLWYYSEEYKWLDSDFKTVKPQKFISLN